MGGFTGLSVLNFHKEDNLAKKALQMKATREPKFKVRAYNRCPICGRPRGFLRKFGICRICFRTLASGGKLPGVIKSSW
jgi:small subunit ribosomal protein S14